VDTHDRAPQLLAEIDGVEQPENVIVIGVLEPAR